MLTVIFCAGCPAWWVEPPEKVRCPECGSVFRKDEWRLRR